MGCRFAVLTGDGINCAPETAWAFELAGGEAEILHVNDLLDVPHRLLDFDGLALPGGFSFGDDLGSGQLLALKLRHSMGNVLQQFVARGAPIIGICNGFQVLTKLGLLPFPQEERAVAIGSNQQGRFINKWVELECSANSVCIWTKGLEQLSLPIRHGEGRVVLRADQEDRLYRRLRDNGQIVLRYTETVNGSYDRIAGLCDPSGLIFGLMPHPEAHLLNIQHPQNSAMPFLEASGLKIFQNIVDYCQSR